MFYLLRLSALLVVTVPLAMLTIGLGPMDPQGKRAYRINQLWTWLILRLGGVSLRVRGLENIHPGEPYIFMANHQSNVDIPVLIQSLNRFQLRWIAKKELLRVPLFGWAMWATKHITVDRADPLDGVKSLERARRKIAAGISVVIFPEGTRSRDGRLLPFKKGGFLIAAKTGVRIVPVTIVGSSALLPSGDWHLRPGSIDVFIDPPIAAKEYRIGKLKALSDRVREHIAARLQQPTRASGAAPASEFRLNARSA
jgi:1-acyl-sn-glycerol-3-phosphate acyltransferase